MMQHIVLCKIAQFAGVSEPCWKSHTLLQLISFLRNKFVTACVKAKLGKLKYPSCAFVL
jgi:hypothetical protein